MSTTFDRIIDFIRAYFEMPAGIIPLHEPRFAGNEKKYIIDAIDSTFVSSVGQYVNRFEEQLCNYTGATHAVATVNGTAALHICLMLAGVRKGDLVITQPLTFVATCNAITYIGADPLFVDIERSTLGLSPRQVQNFLQQECEVRSGKCFHISSNRPISACVPMHTFGHPSDMNGIIKACDAFHIPVVEDAAESIGSRYSDAHTGTIGLLGAFSFNGNKTITCGGGGIIVTNDEALARAAKHITTVAKVPHAFEFIHDELGYNYRLPNLNAAMACAQMEMLDQFIASKRELANEYQSLLTELNLEFIEEPKGSQSNYWLNSVLFRDFDERNAFLEYSCSRGIMTRPVWKLMPDLVMYKDCICSDISTARYVADRLVNLPSSAKI